MWMHSVILVADMMRIALSAKTRSSQMGFVQGYVVFIFLDYWSFNDKFSDLDYESTWIQLVC